MPYSPELLAPAGNWESLVAVVQNGADAVYLGGKLFNARHSAANFEDEEIIKAIEYAHVRGVKVYVAVNILIADREMEKAVRFLFFLQNAGADAVIVQDMGLAVLAHSVIPELPLHASTQMTVHNLPALEHLLNMGFKRVVLAREMSLQEIKALKEQVSAEMEVFIHGALCVCYSGQCLFSSMVGGRSGNRGRCAQPCRLQYTLVDERGRVLVEPGQVGEYLLSPRDLNMSRHLSDLVGAGIEAFKIEGRMKRPEYVAVVTRVYRELIDRALTAGAEEFYVTPQESWELAQVFNRQFTTGYFYGRQWREMMSYKRPNNRGVFLGRVSYSDWDSGYVQVVLEDALHVGDSLEIWVTRGGRAGFEVHDIFIGEEKVESAMPGQAATIPFKGTARKGDRVFKTHDAELMKRARATFASPKESRKLPVDFYVQARVDEPLTIRVEDGGGNSGKGITKSAGQPAFKHPLNAEHLRRQLDRLGNTPFTMKEFRCDLKGEVIVPLGEINEARRQALFSLEQARLKAARAESLAPAIFEQRLSAALKDKTTGRPVSCRELPLLAVAVGDFLSLKAAVSARADLIYFGGEAFHSRPLVGRDELFRGYEFCREHGVKFIFATPRIIHDRELEMFYALLEEVSRWPVDGVLTGNLGLLDRIKSKELPSYADYALNTFNSLTTGYLVKQSAVQVTLSPELTMEQIRQVIARTQCAVEVLIHGNVELMVSGYCALGNLMGNGHQLAQGCPQPCERQNCALKDRLGIIFPLEVDRFCRLHVFNSRHLCLLDGISMLVEAGVGTLRIDARRQGPAYVEAVVLAYRRAIHTQDRSKLAALKELLARFSPEGVTSGHFFRGVL
ncbi:MAG TPA: peptidase U32 [Desulfotomaculum sp.]|nr:peptidase U32 [Desulfotomaculum sp.]